MTGRVFISIFILVRSKQFVVFQILHQLTVDSILMMFESIGKTDIAL